MEIIKATEKHIPEILELWIEFMKHHEEIDPRFPMRAEAPANFEIHIRKQMEAEDTLVLAALDEGGTVGFAVANIASYPPIFEFEKYGAIDSITVETRSRRKGIGDQLMDKIYEWFDS
ncbi:MAG: GNAT family N-acetyltransferase, partial [Dehalococcoidales bacterium]